MSFSEPTPNTTFPRESDVETGLNAPLATADHAGGSSRQLSMLTHLRVQQEALAQFVKGFISAHTALSACQSSLSDLAGSSTQKIRTNPFWEHLQARLPPEPLEPSNLELVKFDPYMSHIQSFDRKRREVLGIARSVLDDTQETDRKEALSQSRRCLNEMHDSAHEIAIVCRESAMTQLDKINGVTLTIITTMSRPETGETATVGNVARDAFGDRVAAGKDALIQ